MIKRIFDLFISSIILFILLPLFMIVGLLIKALMPGKVFYLHERVGLNGKMFKVIKFRTMTEKDGSIKSSFDLGNKSRVTAFGALLRKTKIDELPQFINVLKGEMSIVGPRPEVKEWTMVYAEKWSIVHSVKPGITDNASIVYRNEELLLNSSDNPKEIYQEKILPEKLKLNIEYAHKHNFILDIKIILKTILSVLTK